MGVSEVQATSHRDNEWFTYSIKVDRKKVIVKVNDELVNEFSESGSGEGAGRLDWGTIGFEAAGGDGVVYFRNPMIRLLPDTQ